MSNINFRTPSGLKIRLNHRYFFYQITNKQKYCTEEEIVNNDIMYNATKKIERLYALPTALIQIFTVIAVACKMDIHLFCIIFPSLYALGCLWQRAKQDSVLSQILLSISALYIPLWWLVYIALIVLFAMSNISYFISYVAIRILLLAFALLRNHVILKATKKKYGVCFNDTEICAFRIFHLVSGSELSLPDYISEYTTYLLFEDDNDE